MAGIMSPKKPCPPLPFKTCTQPPSTFNNTHKKKKKKKKKKRKKKKQQQKMMKEVAKEELKILEAQHPTRFQHLKLQLKEFIHLLDQQEDQPKKLQFITSLITQESSSNRKRRREEEENDDDYRKLSKTKTTRRKGIHDAIHKAEACLLKIQTLKSFFCSSHH